jgi:hypothetical protein
MRYLLFALTLIAGPALAEDRDLCPDRPGLGTPACTVEPGKLVAEIGLGDWAHERDAQTRTDTVLAGDALLRVGLTDSLEGQVGWTMFGRQRTRDLASGMVDKASRIGDVTLALRQNLHNPDGSGFSLAVMPYATLPVGRRPIGAGDWGVGLIVPVSVELSDKVSLTASPEIDAAVDEDGHGRHLAYGSVAGLGFDLSSHLSAAAEVSLVRDRDPEGHETEALAGLSAGWQRGDDTQFDIGVNLGLNGHSPDHEVYFGVSRRF